ncbi:M48 family metallopeptidase [Filimonas effusa]|uniref:M48 family peptidase n=1 Tax=Filimonas effusa TaxID=2508721 RepID=A0A4V1MAN5_9BACT|nr:M48 family metallopeptidase [Filimonas effusa]RXK86496.1 M48 family peptidase [Filimonas effusa]
MTRTSLIAVVAIATAAAACSRNSITGRSQLSLVSESELQTAALTEYKQFLSENKVVSSAASKDADMVKRVGNRIATAITKYYQQKGNANELKDYKWEFNLVDSKEVNAWCMPGGKVVVYTGLLPITRDEASLAVVLGHEITHAVAGHSRERMSQQMVAQGLQTAGGVALGNNTRALNIFNAIYAPGAQVGVLLPNSRKQESEADHYGLIFAAMAGYNPEVAVSFWERMAAAGGQKPPLLLSSHPSDEQRIANIKKLMPEALKYYTPVRN